MNEQQVKKGNKALGIFLGLLSVAVICGVSYFFANRSSSDSGSTREITLSEIQDHASSTDCWLAIEGGVYDVTEYIPSHPGGSAIIKGCGKDASTLFNNREGVGTAHSALARSILSRYKIGVLKK